MAAASAHAGITTAGSGGTTEIGGRIRWGATGFEASLFDNDPFAQNPTLNPGGAPVWLLNNAYKFEIAFSSTTGDLTLKVDFDNSNSFGLGESISKSTFNSPPQTSYAGLGFNYLSITGNESGSTARSELNNLMINGTSLPSLVPNGTSLAQFYKDSSGNPIMNITITGDLTFLTTGTAQERPSWNFNFQNSAPPVPAPAGAGLVAIGLGLVGWFKRRFA